ncbi:MAG: hypothetical protein HPY60_09340 [Candidatus Methanofastidiosum sp.]|nr:hypothetical protein [Methanofastidiosum sp.]
MLPKNQLSKNEIDDSPDPTWKGLYKAGGISAILYVLLALVFPFFMFINHTQLIGMVNGTDVINYIIENGYVWWISLQSLVLCASFFAIITFAALFVALKTIDKSMAAIGSIIAIVIHILFIAYYPVLVGLVYLAQNYQTANEIQRASLATAAEALLAMNNAFNPVYEPVFAISILILSLVMLKGIFNKKVAYLGILTSIAAFIAVPLFPIIGINYFWWWMLFNIWFIALGWKLYKLGNG